MVKIVTELSEGLPYGTSKVGTYDLLIYCAIAIFIMFLIRILILSIRKDEGKFWRVIKCILIYGTMFISIIALYGITYLNIGKATYNIGEIEKFAKITITSFGIFAILIIVEIVINRKKTEKSKLDVHKSN